MDMPNCRGFYMVVAEQRCPVLGDNHGGNSLCEVVGLAVATDAAGQCQPPPQSPAPSPAEPSLDEVIDQAIGTIVEGCAPGALDAHVSEICRLLAARRAGGVVTDACRARLNHHLSARKLTTVTKKAWANKLKEAAACYAIANPPGPDSPAAAEDMRATVRDALPDAPVPAGVVVPPGWKLTRTGVYRAGTERDGEVLSTPLLVVARLIDGADHTESLELAWHRDGRWQHHVCGRAEVATRHSITDLAAQGLPVTCLNADDVVGYLADSEAANIGALPRRRLSRQLGWVDKAHSGFLWGRTYLGDADGAETGPAAETDPLGNPMAVPPAACAATESPQGAGAGPVLFRGADLGDEQAADGYHAAGTFDGWRAAVEPALSYPRVRLVVTASLAAPLISLLAAEGAHNFTIDTCGETCQGKTTTNRAAASAWGLPDEDSRRSAMTTWNATRVGAERRAGLVNGLPIIRDDTKLARRPEEVAQFLYDVTTGGTRERGTVKGLERASAFSTIMLISGESRAVSLSGDGGTRARTLTLWGAPFGGGRRDHRRAGKRAQRRHPVALRPRRPAAGPAPAAQPGPVGGVARALRRAQGRLPRAGARQPRRRPARRRLRPHLAGRRAGGGCPGHAVLSPESRRGAVGRVVARGRGRGPCRPGAGACVELGVREPGELLRPRGTGQQGQQAPAGSRVGRPLDRFPVGRRRVAIPRLHPAAP
jgi:hypothetical protein